MNDDGLFANESVGRERSLVLDSHKRIDRTARSFSWRSMDGDVDLVGVDIGTIKLPCLSV